MKIHHLGIVVSDVDEVLIELGLSRDDIVETIADPNQNNNIYFIHLAENNLWLELVEPMSDESTTASFAKKHRIGLHHLAMEADDLEAVEKEYVARPANFALGRYGTKVDSFGGNIRTLFIAVKGLILEFVKIEK